jgi:O-methyltransferase domain/Dimerisation domain
MIATAYSFPDGKAYWLAQAVYVAAKLGVADLLKDGPKSCRSLAAAMGVDQQALARLMRALSSGATCGGRCSSWLGDFFKDVPAGADAYILCGVLHDWDDEHALQILKNCHRAVAKKGRVLLVETVVPDTDANCFSKLLDLNMLVMTEDENALKLSSAPCSRPAATS